MQKQHTGWMNVRKSYSCPLEQGTLPAIGKVDCGGELQEGEVVVVRDGVVLRVLLFTEEKEGCEIGFGRITLHAPKTYRGGRPHISFEARIG